MAPRQKQTTADDIRDRNTTRDVLFFEVRIEGRNALLMHNAQLSDPLNPYAQALKAVSGKKRKTDADHEEMARIEMEGGLWLNADKRVCVPGNAIDGVMRGGASVYRLGKKFTAAVYAPEESYELEYDGPKDIAALVADRRFRDRRCVSVQMAKIWRTRPKFDKWALNFTLLMLNDAGVTIDNVRQALEDGGRRVGLGDYRPKFGHFDLVKFDEA